MKIGTHDLEPYSGEFNFPKGKLWRCKVCGIMVWKSVGLNYYIANRCERGLAVGFTEVDGIDCDEYVIKSVIT